MVFFIYGHKPLNLIPRIDFVIHSGNDNEAIGESMFFSPSDQDELFEQNIDDFDEKMDNEYDDGIAQSNIEDLYDEDVYEEEGDDDDDITPHDMDDEGNDYDELED